MNLLGANVDPYCFRLRGWVRFIVGCRVVMAPQQRTKKRDRQVSTCHFLFIGLLKVFIQAEVHIQYFHHVHGLYMHDRRVRATTISFHKVLKAFTVQTLP